MTNTTHYEHFVGTLLSYPVDMPMGQRVEVTLRDWPAVTVIELLGAVFGALGEEKAAALRHELERRDEQALLNVRMRMLERKLEERA
jgi:hypothetical protein